MVFSRKCDKKIKVFYEKLINKKEKNKRKYFDISFEKCMIIWYDTKEGIST